MNKDLKKIIKEIECYQNEDMCLIMLSQKENKALLDYKNECTKEFNCIKNALEILLDKMKEIKEGNK